MPPPFQRHLFVCTNERAAHNPKGCCAAKGAHRLRERFKKLIIEAGLKGVDGGNLPRMTFGAEIGRFSGVFRLSSRVAHEKNPGNTLVVLLAVKVAPGGIRLVGYWRCGGCKEFDSPEYSRGEELWSRGPRGCRAAGACVDFW